MWSVVAVLVTARTRVRALLSSRAEHKPAEAEQQLWLAPIHQRANLHHASTHASAYALAMLVA